MNGLGGSLVGSKIINYEYISMVFESILCDIDFFISEKKASKSLSFGS
jgi:hypothetical protein